MTARFIALTALAASALAVTPGHAQDTITGRWAADDAFCGGMGATAAQSPLVVSDYAVRWFGESCRIGRSYKTGETVHIEALCGGSSGERSVPVSLRAQGERLYVTWDRGTRRELRRCR